MTAEERVKYYRARGFNCCQTVLCALGEYSGLSEATAAALGSGFGGGIQCGSVCGAVTGAVMAMGRACFAGKDPAADKPRAEALTKALEAEMLSVAGTLMCADIRRAYEKTRCPEYMIAMVTAAERIIREAQAQAQS